MWLVQEPSETPPAGSSSAGWPMRREPRNVARGELGRAPHGREAAVVAEREDDARRACRPRGCGRARSRDRRRRARARRSTPQASSGTVFLTSPACIWVATAVMPGREPCSSPSIRSSSRASARSAERPSSGEVPACAGTPCAVSVTQQPALREVTIAPDVAAALEAERGVRAVHRRERVRRDVAALLVGHAVQLHGGVDAVGHESLERGQTDEDAALHVGDAGPEGALALHAQRPHGRGARRRRRCRDGRAAASAGRRVRRARDHVQADGRRQEVDCATGLAGPARDQRRARVEARAMPGRRVDRAQLAQALEIAGGQGGGHARQCRAEARRRAAAAGGRRRARQHARGLDAEPALEQRGVDRAEVGRDDQVVVVVEAGRPGNSLRMPPFARLPTSSSRPPAPWSVPAESLSSGRRPNSLQISVSTRCESPRASRSACQARSESPTSWSSVGVRLGLRIVRVEAAARDRRRRACRSRLRACAPRLPKRLPEVGVGIGQRRRSRLVFLGERREAVVRLDRVAVHRAHGGQRRVLRACSREAAVDREEGLLVPDVRDVEAEVAGRGDRRDRGAATVHRGILAPADVDALERVVARPDDVQRAAEPAAAVGRRPHDAAAPEAARAEVRLVRVGVVDRRQHGHLAGVVELAQPGQAGMPAEARVVGERQRRRGIDADARAQLRGSAGRPAARAC